jgi:hypothetical protein
MKGIMSLLFVVMASTTSPAQEYTSLSGSGVAFGEGAVSTYVVLDDAGNPSVIGTRFDAAGLDGPPEGGSDLHHCTDRNSDGTVDKPAECVMTHEFVVPIPEEIASRDDVPFKWVLLNWNPMGHIPPGIYDSPHFDVHFMIEAEDSIFAIKTGACGPEFVDCDQFEVAQRTVPANYAPSDFKDVGAVAPAMGNHLVDLTGEEFSGVPWERSFIFGAYDGEVTFWEEMLTIDYLKGANKCTPIKRPDGVAIAGYYPTESCARKDDMNNTYTVSLENFEYREASPPGALASRVPPPPPGQTPQD